MTLNNNFLSKRIITSQRSIREALILINSLSEYLTLFVVDKKSKLIGTVTDGDIRRGIIEGLPLDNPIDAVMNANFKSFHEGELTISKIKSVKAEKINLLPILDRNRKIEYIINLDLIKSLLPVNAFIMAGGMGKRLLPLTENIPKPLVKIKDKAIIDYNIERLMAFGIKNIYISLNHLGSMIVEHIKMKGYEGVNIDFVWEDRPLGTAGSIGLVDNFSSEDILVLNSDLLCTIDYENFFLDYTKHNASVSIATVPYNISIPYAVLNTDNYNVLSLEEKPNYTYYSNAGIYLIRKSVISKIKKNTFLDMTDFIESVILEKKKVISYPLRSYWQDIGSHKDLIKASQDIEHLKF